MYTVLLCRLTELSMVSIERPSTRED